MIRNTLEKLQNHKHYEAGLKFFKFGLVGGFGTVLNTAILFLLTTYAGMYYILASIIATEIAIISNFIGNHWFTFKKHSSKLSIWNQFLRFQGISMFTIVGTIFILWALTTTFGIKYLLIWNLIAILVMFLANFALNHKYTWGKKHATQVAVLLVALLTVGSVSAAGFGITTTPVEADVYLDNTFLGTTDVGGTLITNVTEGKYTLNVSKTGYDTYSEPIEIVNGTNNASVTLNITVLPPPPIFNGTLFIESTPDAVDVTINGSSSGTTSGNELTRSLEPGSYELFFTKAGYTNDTQVVEILENETTNVTTTLTFIPVETAIIANSSNVSGFMFETQTAAFSVTLNQADNITWSVDGEVVQTTTDTTDTLTWTPDIFYTDSSLVALISVTAGNDSTQFVVTVDNAVNPFFAGGSGETMEMHVFTNNLFWNATEVNLTIESDDGLTVFELLGIVSGDETDWKTTGSAVVGTNAMKEIRTYNSMTDVTRVFTLTGTERTHTGTESSGTGGTDETTGGSDSRPSGGGGGGGGGAPGDLPALNTGPEVVYVTFENDVISDSESQVITLDAKTGFGDAIKGVVVTIRTPEGTSTETLDLLEGDDGYGTWGIRLQSLSPGEHTITKVTLDTLKGEVDFDVSGRTFYVNDGDVITRELSLVYSLLDKSYVDSGNEVTLRIDAADASGVTEAEAVVETSTGETFTVPLDLVQGDGVYGTWEGRISAEDPDTTYTVTQIKLASAEQQKSYPVAQRSFYVAPLEVENSPDLLTGNVVAEPLTFERLAKEPLFPTAIGFGLMLAIISIIILSSTVREKIVRRR